MVAIRVCECCGHPLPSDSVRAFLSRHQKRFFDIVEKAGTNGIEIDQLYDQLYQDARNGGPFRQIIPVTARQIRQKIEPFGITILGSRGPGSRYYLVTMSEKPRLEIREASTLRRWRRKGKK